MIRCPFNNFSKCDGSCPFSTANFTHCGLSALLTSLEGQSRGQLAQIATANAHLVEVKEKLDALNQPKADGEQATAAVPMPPAARRKASNPDGCYIAQAVKKRDGRIDVRLSLNADMADLVEREFGSNISAMVVGNPAAIVTCRGNGLKLSRVSDGQRATASLSGQREAILTVFGRHHYIYLDGELANGMLRFTPTGEVED